MKYIEIGNICFENCGTVKLSLNSMNYGWDDNEILDVYTRPSYRKIGIWKDWVKWGKENRIMVRISSHNSNFFSVEGYSCDRKYYFKITYAHNRVYKIVN